MKSLQDATAAPAAQAAEASEQGHARVSSVDEASEPRDAELSDLSVVFGGVASIPVTASEDAAERLRQEGLLAAAEASAAAAAAAAATPDSGAAASAFTAGSDASISAGSDESTLDHSATASSSDTHDASLLSHRFDGRLFTDSSRGWAWASADDTAWATSGSSGDDHANLHRLLPAPGRHNVHDCSTASSDATCRRPRESNKDPAWPEASAHGAPDVDGAKVPHRVVSGEHSRSNCEAQAVAVLPSQAMDAAAHDLFSIASAAAANQDFMAAQVNVAQGQQPAPKFLTCSCVYILQVCVPRACDASGHGNDDWWCTF